MFLAAVIAARICTSRCPSPPTQVTTTVEPGTSFGNATIDESRDQA